MASPSTKIKYAILGALIVPFFGRLALHGTGHAHEYYRYLVPLFIGGLAGFLIGAMKDRWLGINSKLHETNEKLKESLNAKMQADEALRKNGERYRTLFNDNHAVMLLIDPEDARIVDANPAALSYYGWNLEELTAKKITDINMLDEKQVFQEIEKARQEHRRHFNFKHRLSSGDVRDVEVFSGPIEFEDKQLLLSIIHDITKRKKVEAALHQERDKLKQAIEEIKSLSGLLPICSSCKKIRDDKGYWNQIESYIRDHSEADFSHSICPECAEKLYPGFDVLKDRPPKK